MPIQISCPQPTCRKVLLVPDAGVGKAIHCPHCQKVFQADALPSATLSLPPAAISAPPSLEAPPTIPTPISPEAIIADFQQAHPAVSDGTLPGRIGRLEIRQRLGEGAFGVVYRAYDAQLDREVAVKVAKPHTLNSETRVKRFLREAKAAANLRHPNIVPVFDSGQDGDQYFIASAFIPGKSLAGALEEQPEGKGLEVRRAVEIVRRLAEALAYAHSKGVIHRDIKPANAMLDDQGEALLVDFGLAARAEGDEKLTQEATMMGTPAYLAPEQAAGLAEAASDQYSLGCTLYELLTGRTPFSGPLEMQILLHRTQEPTSPRKLSPNLPRDLETICLKCLAKKPGERYAGCRELADDLRRWLEGEPIAARRLSWRERSVRWVRRNPAVAGLTTTVAVLLVTGTVVASFFALRAERNAAQLVEANEKRALSQVNALLTANPQAVLTIIEGLEPFRDTVNPRLHELIVQPGLNESQRLRVSLALLPVDPGQKEYLYRRLLEAPPQEAVVIRDALQRHQKDFLADLWTVVESADKKRDAQRLRAAAALALYDPANPRWDKISGPVVVQLVKENPVYLQTWLTAFRPVKEKLGQPLSEVFADHRDERKAERAIATSLLDDYATDQPDLLANLLMDADPEQFALFFPKVEAERGRSVNVWNGMVTVPLASEPSQDGKEHLAKRQANAAVALLRVGATEKVWPLLKEQSDPRTRSYLIHRLVPFGVSSHPFEADVRSLIIQRLDVEKDVSIRRALLVCLGELGLKGISDRDALVRKVEALYQNEADAGLHGAAEWCLRQWQKGAIDQPDRIKALEQSWVKDKAKRDARQKQISGDLAPGKARWYVTGQGQTMVVVPGPVEFKMGSPTTETDRGGGPDDKTEDQHTKRIAHSFAIASKEVTVAQFLRFRKGQYYFKPHSPGDDHPINSVSWYEAAAYCNWLSEQEGIDPKEWCYEPNQQQYGAGMRLARDYLTRTGYRLPTESEWEYACRAGTVTSRSYGEREDLLGHYAWYTKNSHDKEMLRVGSLKPNDLGLFDMLGNAVEWCQDSLRWYEAGPDREDTNLQVTNDLSRMLRGGSFNYQASFVRSANRYANSPAIRFNYSGFRPARTFR